MFQDQSVFAAPFTQLRVSILGAPRVQKSLPRPKLSAGRGGGARAQPSRARPRGGARRVNRGEPWRRARPSTTASTSGRGPLKKKEKKGKKNEKKAEKKRKKSGKKTEKKRKKNGKKEEARTFVLKNIRQDREREDAFLPEQRERTRGGRKRRDLLPRRTKRGDFHLLRGRPHAGA